MSAPEKTRSHGTLLEDVAHARDHLHDCATAYETFSDAIRRAHRAHTWNEIARVAGLTKHGVRYAALPLQERRRRNGTPTD